MPQGPEGQALVAALVRAVAQRLARPAPGRHYRYACCTYHTTLRGARVDSIRLLRWRFRRARSVSTQVRHAYQSARIPRRLRLPFPAREGPGAEGKPPFARADARAPQKDPHQSRRELGFGDFEDAAVLDGGIAAGGHEGEGRAAVSAEPRDVSTPPPSACNIALEASRRLRHPAQTDGTAPFEEWSCMRSSSRA